MSTPIKLLLADDHPAVITGINAIIEATAADIEIVGAASNSTELIACLDHQPCDVLMTDYSMPGGAYGDGLPLLSLLARRYPKMRVVVHTALDNPAILARIRAEGTHGVLSKSDDPMHIVSSVRAVARDEVYISPVMQSILQASNRIEAFGWQSLSRQEAEVIRLFVSGLTINEIAKHMHRVKQTISRHKIAAMQKLGIKHNVDLFRYVEETKLLSLMPQVEADRLVGW